MDLFFSPPTVSALVMLAVITLGLALRPDPGGKSIQGRIEAYVERDDAAAPGATREVHGSFLRRVILPLLRRILRALGRLAPSHTLDDIGQRLMVAGRPGNLSAADFLGLCIILGSIGLMAGFIAALGPKTEAVTLLLRPVAGALLGFMAPRFWLNSKVSRRKDMIQRALPDALDMLTVCVEAGLAFESAMQRVADRWPGPLTDELGRVVAEIRLGVPRSQALRRMAQRCDTPDVSSFVAVLVQADSMGTSIAHVIHSQADQIRVLRRQRAEEKANKAPIKVLVPMVLFIFPALFIVILGPGIPKILEALGNAGGM